MWRKCFPKKKPVLRKAVLIWERAVNADVFL